MHAQAAVDRLAQLLYFMLPAYAANMTPPFMRYWKGWNPPIAPRYLGAHKTVLGFVSGVCAAILVASLQALIAWPGSLVPADPWLGIRLGLGAMAGDSAKSFVKRRLGIPPGARWIPFDQLDFVAGALLLTCSRASLTWVDVAAIAVLTFVGHILVDHLGYWLHIRDTRW
jgi:CDP-2,3-bis-(O-geranylgeranyl)-sn-glycerol synthase